MANRSAMMDGALRAFFSFVGTGDEVDRINCHHNFTQREVHDGRRALDNQERRDQGCHRRPRSYPGLDGYTVIHRKR